MLIKENPQVTCFCDLFFQIAGSRTHGQLELDVTTQGANICNDTYLIVKEQCELDYNIAI